MSSSTLEATPEATTPVAARSQNVEIFIENLDPVRLRVTSPTTTFEINEDWGLAGVGFTADERVMGVARDGGNIWVWEQQGEKHEVACLGTPVAASACVSHGVVFYQTHEDGPVYRYHIEEGKLGEKKMCSKAPPVEQISGSHGSACIVTARHVKIVDEKGKITSKLRGSSLEKNAKKNGLQGAMKQWIESRTPQEVEGAWGELEKKILGVSRVMRVDGAAWVKTTEEGAGKNHEKKIAFKLPGEITVVKTGFETRILDYNSITSDPLWWTTAETSHLTTKNLSHATAGVPDPTAVDDITYSTAIFIGEDRVAHPTDPQDYSIVLDDLGMYSLIEENVQISLLKTSSLISMTPLVLSQAHAVTVPLYWQKLLHRKSIAPECLMELLDALPPYIVPVVLVMLSNFAGDGDEAGRLILRWLCLALGQKWVGCGRVDGINNGHRCVSRAESLIHLWSGNLCNAVAKAVDARDVHFLSKIFERGGEFAEFFEADVMRDAGRIVFSKLMSGSVESWCHSGVEGLDEKIADVADEARPVDVADVQKLRDGVCGVLTADSASLVEFCHAERAPGFVEGAGEVVGALMAFLTGSATESRVVEVFSTTPFPPPPTPLTPEACLSLITKLTTPPDDDLSMSISSMDSYLMLSSNLPSIVYEEAADRGHPLDAPLSTALGLFGLEQG